VEDSASVAEERFAAEASMAESRSDPVGGGWSDQYVFGAGKSTVPCSSSGLSW
jgi:hypothetical protein